MRKDSIVKFNFTLLISFIICAFVILLRPLDLNLDQSIILGALILTLIWWTTGVVNKICSSLFLLFIFSIFGSTPIKTVFQFPLSENFIMIVFSFLLSQGIVNAKIADGFSKSVLNKYGNTPYKLIILTFIFSIVLIFIIPQPFSRVIMLASIYEEFMRHTKLDSKPKEILLFSVFAISSTVNMLFVNGDIILNYAALGFGQIGMGDFQWIKYMTLPSLIYSVIIGILLIVFFNKELKNMDLSSTIEDGKKEGLSLKGKIGLIIMVATVILWVTEDIHGISSAIVTVISTILMFAAKILEKKDLRSVNIELLFFLTAAFSIGNVMKNSGTAAIIYSNIMEMFPKEFSYLYVVMLVFTVMILHMVLGSTITTLSVVIPGLIQLTTGVMDPVLVVLIAYITVNMHYILPFHHVVIMIGAGNDYYSNKTVMRFGIPLSFLVFVAMFFLYIPWWKFLGVM